MTEVCKDIEKILEMVKKDIIYMFIEIDKRNIDLEDKFITFRCYIQGLNDGYYSGLWCGKIVLGPKTDIPILRDIITTYNKFDDKEISMQDAWKHIAPLARGEKETEYVI